MYLPRTILLTVRVRHRHKANTGSASLPQPPDIATTCTLSSSSLDSDDHVRTLAPRVLLQPPPDLGEYAPPPGLEKYAHLCASHGIPVKAAPLRPRLRSAISVTPPQSPACTIHVGTHHARSATTGKRSASTALAETHNPVDAGPRAGTGPFPQPRDPRSSFGPLWSIQNPEGHGGIDTADSDLMHHQFRLSLLQWNPGPARRNPTNIVSAACGKYHAVILQEASDHRSAHLRSVPCVHPATRTLLSCSIKTPLSLTLYVLTYKVDSTKQRHVG